MMSKLTKNVWRHELICKCGCGFNTLDWETLTVLQETCDHFTKWFQWSKSHLVITSAARCEDHNKLVKGSPNSQHLLGRAVDFRIRGISPELVYNYLIERYDGKYGIGKYETFTHLDTRTGPPKRW
jgi:uncharacterized protein YcbK (DUF882 family)